MLVFLLSFQQSSLLRITKLWYKKWLCNIIKTIIMYRDTNYILDSLVVIISLAWSTRIKVDEFNIRALLRVATRSITHEAERRASASWSQHSSIVSQIDKSPYIIHKMEYLTYFEQLLLHLLYWRISHGKKCHRVLFDLLDVYAKFPKWAAFLFYEQRFLACLLE